MIAYEIDADADDDNVIEIFARLNQQGVRLRPGDLAAARLTGQMTNFRTRAREVLVMKELRGFSAPEGAEEGSRSGAFVDTDLLIRAALFLGGGGVRYRDAEKRKVQIHYQNIEASWDAAVAGFKSAVALFRNAGLPSGDWLPYRYLLFPPAIAAARGHALDERWTGWALAASLWRHYAGEVDTKLAKDAALAERGDIDGLIEHVKLRAKRPESAIPEDDDLLHNIVGENAILFALLAYFPRVNARSFPSGKLLSGAQEPLEVHQIFPRASLDRYPDRDNEYVPDRLGNLTLLVRSDNEHIGETAPDVYLRIIEPADRAAHLIPGRHRPVVDHALQRVLRAARARAGRDAARSAVQLRGDLTEGLMRRSVSRAARLSRASSLFVKQNQGGGVSVDVRGVAHCPEAATVRNRRDARQAVVPWATRRRGLRVGARHDLPGSVHAMLDERIVVARAHVDVPANRPGGPVAGGRGGEENRSHPAPCWDSSGCRVRSRRRSPRRSCRGAVLLSGHQQMLTRESDIVIPSGMSVPPGSSAVSTTSQSVLMPNSLPPSIAT